MNLFESINWIWPALMLAFLLGFIARRWLGQRSTVDKSKKVSEQYFKGLNFLLNEQPDKAIEVFIKALEVDSETVELHLALGGLFRRKGHVDRATRIHQNLIARPNLTENQRLQAINELAQDYLKAGLLDRAENLYLELIGSSDYRAQAIEGLCNIYQQEKDWAKAIEILRMHKRSLRGQQSVRVANYWCELAQQSLDNNEYEAAKRYLRNAQSEHKSSARAQLLRGELHFRQQRFKDAIRAWQVLADVSPALSQLVVDKTIQCYRSLKDFSGLSDYLSNTAAIPKDQQAFDIWLAALIESFGEQLAEQRLFEQIEAAGLSAPLANYLYKNTEQDQLSIEQYKQLLKDLLRRAKNRKIEYTCAGCGFDTKAMYWLCPNCGEWDSFS